MSNRQSWGFVVGLIVVVCGICLGVGLYISWRPQKDERQQKDLEVASEALLEKLANEWRSVDENIKNVQNFLKESMDKSPWKKLIGDDESAKNGQNFLKESKGKTPPEELIVHIDDEIEKAEKIVSNAEKIFESVESSYRGLLYPNVFRQFLDHGRETVTRHRKQINQLKNFRAFIRANLEVESFSKKFAGADKETTGIDSELDAIQQADKPIPQELSDRLQKHDKAADSLISEAKKFADGVDGMDTLASAASGITAPMAQGDKDYMLARAQKVREAANHIQQGLNAIRRKAEALQAKVRKNAQRNV